MVGSSQSVVTPKRTGTETQTFCVMVSVQLIPPSLVTQSTSGAPWQATLMLPTTAVGVSVTGAVTSTH